MIGTSFSGRLATTNLNFLLIVATLSASIDTSSAIIKANRLIVRETKDLRWPNKQVNVLIDQKTLNSTEQLILNSILDQLSHKTCVQVKRLSPDEVNPFAPLRGGLNFLYIFKSQVGSSNQHPSIGLSSFGCVKQGRQSLVLTDLAFKWPELVLRHHVMRSLGVEHVERPDVQVRRLLNMLPLSQKITSEDYSSSSAASTGTTDKTISLFEYPSYFAYAATPAASAGPQEQIAASVKQVSYLSDEDLGKIKNLYDCADYQNRLSPKPINQLASDAASTKLSDLLNKSDTSGSDSPPSKKLYSPELQFTGDFEAPAREEAKEVKGAKLGPAEESPKGLLSSMENSLSNMANDSLLDAAAKQIVDNLLATDDQQKSPTTNKPETFSEPTDTDLIKDKKPKLEGEPTALDEFEKLDSLSEGQSNKRSLNGRECQPMETCPLKEPDGAPFDAFGNSLRERPMLLKLDEFHALDPQLKQANQMKLSQLSNRSLDSYRLMNHPNSLSDMWPSQPSSAKRPQSKSEMLISFEQSPLAKDPVTALASSQVLKLCSCQCQTMTPNDNSGDLSSEGTSPSKTTINTATPASSQQPTTMGPVLPPKTEAPTLPTFPIYPTYATNWPVYPTVGPVIPTDDYDFTLPPWNPSSEQPSWPPMTMLPPWPSVPTGDDYEYTTTPAPTTTTSTTTTTTTTAKPTTTTTMTTTTTTTTTPPTTTTSTPSPESTTITQKPETNTEGQMTSSSQMPLLSASACDQVEWVKPNKTVYASARIVWDVDRGNQNYFLCNNQLNGELIPGKTHGFSCKISQEGRAFETHQFNVLTKPEHVNLAWVQRNSNSFGRTNFPVVGGYSKERDPYIVSRCLVKDENNDVITLIGYINNHGVGWFPFDDIQIECAQYDVLACVN